MSSHPAAVVTTVMEACRTYGEGIYVSYENGTIPYPLSEGNRNTDNFFIVLIYVCYHINGYSRMYNVERLKSLKIDIVCMYMRRSCAQGNELDHTSTTCDIAY